MLRDPLALQRFQRHPHPSEKYSPSDIFTKARLINDHKDSRPLREVCAVAWLVDDTDARGECRH